MLLTQVYKQSGTNGAQIDANHDFPTAFRVRMSDLDIAKYGPCNTIRIVNTSLVDITISFTWDVARTNSLTIRANSVHTQTIEDGLITYGFDIYSAHATTDIAAGEIKYTMARVE